jgi:hypothetical protein
MNNEASSIYHLAVQLKYEIALSEFMEMAWLRHRSSMRWIIGICVGVLGFILGVFIYVYVGHGLGVVLISLAIFLLLMQLVIPSLVFRRFYRRNKRLFGMRIVTINDAGIISDQQLGHTETAWNLYERFLETQRLFLLYQSADLIGILPKRAFLDTAGQEQFRSLAVSKIRRQ